MLIFELLSSNPESLRWNWTSLRILKITTPFYLQFRCLVFGVATCLVRRRASLAIEAAERAAAEAAEIMREPETNAFIVDRIKAALDVNKACATEEQRREYLIGLAYVAPPRLAVGNTFPHHRFISSRAKDTAAKFKRNRGPGWIQSDVDFAMDGEIAINGTINGNMFTEGDLAIAVEWYDRTEDDSDGLTFSKWQDTQGDASMPNIVNSTELRAASSTLFD